MAQQGYAIVEVDEDPSGPSHGSGLEFQTFLPSQTDGGHHPASSVPDVPFSPFNLTFYQTYFDVDTTTVLKRVGMAMIPRPGFITEVCDGQIDMYGSFWTLTTLILTLYTTSTLTTSIAQYMSSSHASSNLPLLSTATSAIYVYGLLVPSLLWSVTKWLSVGEWGIAEALGIYGYAMSIFIPLSLLCLIPVGILRWVLIGLGGISSGYFLTGNIYPVLAASDNKFARLLIIVVAVMHAVMALTIKILFFGTSAIGSDPVSDLT
ncbi:hypothetical protein C366_06173 [Cryptococcus neoformans Tu401-1]|nr:hypothetical protein C365_04889 [Cryptococcus neoformans var. grubii Bt85]OXG11134.1 hypothetical protein C366_06173 [Cryptococcus neoformans var. grubii Tu401-1]OXM76044.1 hypothetical protein C364_06148 [Cryptococcus neoformans var. grubii Bt63]